MGGWKLRILPLPAEFCLPLPAASKRSFLGPSAIERFQSRILVESRTLLPSLAPD